MSTPRDEEERKRLLEAEAEIFGKTMGFTTTPTPEQMERTIAMKVNVQDDDPAPDATVRLASPPRQSSPEAPVPDSPSAEASASQPPAQNETNPLDALDNLDDLDALLGNDDGNASSAAAPAADSEPDDALDIERALEELAMPDDESAPAAEPPETDMPEPDKEAFDELHLGTEEISLTQSQMDGEESDDAADIAEPDEHESTITEAAYDFALNNRAPQPKNAFNDQAGDEHIEELPEAPADSAVQENAEAAAERPMETAQDAPQERNAGNGAPETDADFPVDPPVASPPASPPGFAPMPQADNAQPAAKPSIWPILLALLALGAAGGAGWLAFQEQQRADMLEARLKHIERDMLRARARPAATPAPSANTAATEARLDDLQRQLDELTRVVSARLMPPPEAVRTASETASARAAKQPAKHPAPQPASQPAQPRASQAKRPETSAAPAAQGPWIVNISSVTSREAAQRELARMRKLGVQAEAAPVEIRGKTWYRIRISGLPDKAAATKRAKEIGALLGIGDIWVSRAR